VHTVRLRVTLREVTPAVLRVLDVPASCTLTELHDLLQIAIGWTDSHLHQFVVPVDVSADVGEVRYGVPDAEFDCDEHDETGVRLTELPPRFRYLYDFGDGWDHDIEVLGPGEPEPGCRYGEGRCPPEDCGGTSGYAELLQVLADPTHDEHQQMAAWVGAWPEFDQLATDRLVRDMVGRVPPSVALLLELIGDGATLTPGGRLPRALVRQVQQQRPDWYPLDRPAQVEDDLPPLAALHDLLRHVGLLRLSKGVLHRTRAAGDPLEVVRRLRRAFPRREFHSLLAGDLVAVLAAAGPMSPDELADKLFPLFEHGWSTNGHPLTILDLRAGISGMSAQLRGLDQIGGDWRTWQPGAAAHYLLPHATGMTQIWTTSRHKITTDS
jgi:Plasmid pRiA4b ORF-3-like protein